MHQPLVQHFQLAVVCNNKDAFIIIIAQEHQIHVLHFQQNLLVLIKKVVIGVAVLVRAPLVTGIGKCMMHVPKVAHWKK